MLEVRRGHKSKQLFNGATADLELRGSIRMPPPFQKAHGQAFSVRTSFWGQRSAVSTICTACVSSVQEAHVVGSKKVARSKENINGQQSAFYCCLLMLLEPIMISCLLVPGERDILLLHIAGAV